MSFLPLLKILWIYTPNMNVCGLPSTSLQTSHDIQSDHGSVQQITRNNIKPQGKKTLAAKANSHQKGGPDVLPQTPAVFV
jgi:hypothetical protein